jgi:hypothetical protein
LRPITSTLISAPPAEKPPLEQLVKEEAGTAAVIEYEVAVIQVFAGAPHDVAALGETEIGFGLVRVKSPEALQQPFVPDDRLRQRMVVDALAHIEKSR